MLGLLALGLVPVFVAGPRSVLGYYDSVVSLDLSPLPILRWMGADGMLLLYSSGWVLVPGALIGLALALWRPRSRGELGVRRLRLARRPRRRLRGGALRGQRRRPDPGALLLRDPAADRAPLRPLRDAAASRTASPTPLIAGAALALSARVPLAGFSAADGKSNSPAPPRRGHARAEGRRRRARLAPRGDRRGRCSPSSPRRPASSRESQCRLLIGLAIAGSGVASLGAVTFGHQAADERLRHDPLARPVLRRPRRSRRRGAPRRPARTTAGSPPSSSSGTARSTASSCSRMPSPPDAFAFEQTTIGDDGTILVDGKPVHGPAPRGLLQRDDGAPRARSRSRARASTGSGKPDRAPRASRSTSSNRFYDGWLGLTGSHQALAGRGREARRPPRPRPQPAARPHRDRDAPQAPGRERQGGRHEAGRGRARQHPRLLLGPVVGRLRGPGQHELRRAARHGALDEADFTPDPSACS